MWENISPEKSRSFIERHFDAKWKSKSVAPAKPTVTISRQEGAGGLTVASYLSEYLQANTASHEEWTVFSHHLVTKVLDDHKQKKHVADFMKEDHKGTITDALEEFLGLHPSTWTLVEQTNATILRLAQIGNVILIGRGANVVTGELKTAFHVHLVGSLEKRIEQAEKAFNLERKAAIQYIKKKDEARKRYVKDNFDRDINDPLLYHIVINTDMVTHEEAARLIGNEVMVRFSLDKPVKVKGAGSGLM